jgi:hypothetical protein
MYAWFYQGSPLVVYPLVALFIFLCVFLGVLVDTYLRRAPGRYEPLAVMPLADDERVIESEVPGASHD